MKVAAKVADAVSMDRDAWDIASVGRTIAVVGTDVPDAPDRWLAGRIAAATRDGATIAAARDWLADHADHGLIDRAKVALAVQLRRRLLGDHTEPTSLESFVELVNDAAGQVEKPIVLVFDDVASADAATQLLLRDLVAWPGRFQAAVVLHFPTMPRPDAGPAADLLAQVRVIEGPGGLIGTSEGPETYAELHPVPTERESTPI